MPRRWPRSVAAVIAGYLIFGLGAAVLFGVSGQDPRQWPSSAFLVGSTVYGAAFALIAGLVAARIAPARPRTHANIVAAIIAVVAAASLAIQWRAGSVWSEVDVLIFMVPAAVAGGHLVARSAVP